MTRLAIACLAIISASGLAACSQSNERAESKHSATSTVVPDGSSTTTAQTSPAVPTCLHQVGPVGGVGSTRRLDRQVNNTDPPRMYGPPGDAQPVVDAEGALARAEAGDGAALLGEPVDAVLATMAIAGDPQPARLVWILTVPNVVGIPAGPPGGSHQAVCVDSSLIVDARSGDVLFSHEGPPLF